MNLKKSKETDIQKACLELLKLRGIKAWRSNNIPACDPKTGVYRTFHGLKGVADILGIYPRHVRQDDGTSTTYGLILAVEVKQPGKQPSADQRDFLDSIRRAGGIAIVAHSVQELEEALIGLEA